MYKKDLNEQVRLRLSTKDMDFLRALSEERGQSVSECIRYLIGEYRRGMDALDTLRDALDLAKKGGLSHGDTNTDINNIIQH